MDCSGTLLNFSITIQCEVSYVNGALYSMSPEYNMNGAPWRCATWDPWICKMAQKVID